MQNRLAFGEDLHFSPPINHTQNEGKEKKMASLKFNLRTAALIGSLLIGASPALAEAVLHRGNAGEPQTLDQAHTSINIEEFILKDLYEV